MTVGRALDEHVVFNVVWTGTTFTYLRWFVATQVARSRARFRFVVNCCPPEQVAAMERFAASLPDRVVDVRVVAEDRMVRHGDALDVVRATTHDGELFGLIDPDIRARGPFVGALLDAMGDGAAVTSGTEVWTTSNVLPEGQLGVSGEYFFSRDGFTFGSPHLAVYRREVIDATAQRWGVGFGSGGNDLPPSSHDRLAELGHQYLVYDTAKLMNIFLQGDGHRLTHVELDEIVHIGGLAHQLQPTSYQPDEEGRMVPDWKTWTGMELRYEVTRYIAAYLRCLVDPEADPAPPVPEVPDRDLGATMAFVRRELTAMVDEARPIVEAAGG